MKIDKFVFVAIALTIIGLVGGVFLVSRIGEKESVELNTEVKAETTETSFDWGEIGINDGKVEKIFDIKNDGSEILKLSEVSTSCMCTTAQLISGENKSPEFGMHTKSSYMMEVPAGKSAQLKVVFDPAFHGPSGVGPITRQITVATNDPENPTLNFMLSAVVRK